MKKSLSAEMERQTEHARDTRFGFGVEALNPSKQGNYGFVDNRAETQVQRRMMAGINDSSKVMAQRKEAESLHASPRMVAQRKCYGSIGKSATQLQSAPEDELLQGRFETAQRIEEEEPFQGKFEALQRMAEEEPMQGKFATPPIQLQESTADKPNNTGLPDNLKAGIETLSGISMDSVKVHYNSEKPAQLNALAYAQGTDIHVAPGQEKHLPHEAWHVVQQAQGRVQPTMQMKHGFAVNNDKELESEADSMGQKATQAFSQNSNPEKKRQSNILIKTSRNNSVSQQIVQKKIVLDPVKGPFAERTLRDLEMLVGGGSVIVKSNGELAMIGLEQDALTAGWRLLERMILNPHTVVLGYDPNITGPKNKVGNLEDSRDPKKGSGSLVSIPLQVNMSDLVKTSTNELVMEDTERHIILAHELIHADRGQRGKKAKGAGLHDVIGIWKNEVFTKRGVFAVKEELETVGLLLAENDPEQITENMIRAQLGKNLRAAYDEKGLQLPGF